VSRISLFDLNNQHLEKPNYWGGWV